MKDKEKIEYYFVLVVVVLSVLVFMVYNWVETDRLVNKYYQVTSEIIKENKRGVK